MRRVVEQQTVRVVRREGLASDLPDDIKSGAGRLTIHSRAQRIRPEQ